MTSAVPPLEIQGLRFGYGRAETVRGVSLTLLPGDCYGFLGHNGAGKTTVMRLALGLLRPHAGSVRILGHDALRSPRLARAGVGALIERPGFHLHATAHRNLAWLARLQGQPRRLAAADASRTLELLGLGAAAGRPVGGFSMGMRQRLGIAAALLGRPRLLLLDEPGNGLDPEGIADLRRLLRRLADDGTTILLSSHQLLEIDGLCNRIGVLREGAMVVEGDLESLRAGLSTRHVVAGHPLRALEQRLRDLGLAPAAVGNRLTVELGDRAPGAVARELVAVGELEAFAPEPPTLEAIYLRATNGEPWQVPARADTKAPAAEPALPQPTWTTAQRPLLRAFGHELRTTFGRRSTWPLLCVPVAVAAWSVLAYDRRTTESARRVASGQVFSADAGSAFVATAHALQAAVPVLAVVALWLASQTIAAELSHDILRNTLLRSVRRADVLLGKFAAILVALGAGFVATVGGTAALAAALLGFHDLEEVSRHGDRQVLAAATDVVPVLLRSVMHCVPPLAAAAAIGLAASALARRPARAVLLALLLVLAPEILRDALHDHAGWLLTSHLPTGLRDDSAIGYLEAAARGAADAFWRWRGTALVAPLAWMVLPFGVAAATLRRLRVP
ncbi:MAG: ABC transporter ATP-binding protein [Planctomycetes bacterium]|nr:ABC transporter ATP-binding protein [Planctomycetota bacterium]